MQQIQFPHRLGFKKIFTPQILSKHLLMQHTIWASTLFSTCLRRAFCLHHADSDANTCNKYNFLTGMGSRRSSHHRFCSKHAVHATWQIGHLPSSVHASEEPFVCIMQIQTLIHATNTISSQAWVQEDLRTTDFAPSMLFMQHDKLGIYPLQYMPQKNLLSASCRFRC